MGGKRALLRETGVDGPGALATTGKPHLGDLIHKKYGDRITAGHVFVQTLFIIFF